MQKKKLDELKKFIMRIYYLVLKKYKGQTLTNIYALNNTVPRSMQETFLKIQWL